MPMRQAQEIKSDHGGQLEAQLEELRRLEEEKACHSMVASCGEMWRMRWVAVMLESHRDFGRCWGNDSATSMCS